MSITFTVAGDEVGDMLAKVLTSTHPDLAKADVTVACIFATAEEGPALKHHGYAAAAIIKIVPLDQRVAGQCDVLLKIDERDWNLLDTKERVALLDRVCQGIALQLDAAGKVKRDDAGRPKLKHRLPDYSIEIYTDVIKRHGGKSLDLQAFAAVHRTLVQGELFPAE